MRGVALHQSEFCNNWICLTWLYREFDIGLTYYWLSIQNEEVFVHHKRFKVNHENISEVTAVVLFVRWGSCAPFEF